jgi:hypothetical protein
MILSLIAAMASNRIIGNQGDIPLSATRVTFPGKFPVNKRCLKKSPWDTL